MKSWSCKLQTITPLFMSGANQADVELRPPSFKNLMRWWYRAIKADLVEEEDFLFGSTTQTPKFRISLSHENLNTNDKYKIYEEKFKYIGFFPFNKKRQRSFINPGFSFDLKLIFQPSLSIEQKKALFASLWAMFWLGGVGSRQRRGFGSISVEDSKEVKFSAGDAGLQMSFSGKTFEEFKQFLKNNLNIARKWIGAKENISTLPNFTLFSAKYSKIYLRNRMDADWVDSLFEGERILKDWRTELAKEEKNDEREKAKKPISSQTPQFLPAHRATLGLPVHFGKQNDPLTLEGKEHERRASPLFLKVVKLRDKNYALIFILMKAQILEENELVVIENTLTVLKQPSFKVLEEKTAEYLSKNCTEIKL